MSCFRATVCLFSNVVSGLARVGLNWEWVRSVAVFVTESFDCVIGNVKVYGGNYVLSETLCLAVLLI